MFISNFAGSGFFMSAAVAGVRTSGVKIASARGIARVGDFTLQTNSNACIPKARIGLGDRRQKRLCVRVQWIGEERLGASQLDNFAYIHHGDAMADVLHDA